MKISVIICTYNRHELLKYCLNSLNKQTVTSDDFEVVIVNNNSTDKTHEVAENFASLHPNVSIFIEKNQGLSHARNRGFYEANSDWVIYLDDDAKAHKDFVERAIWIIENTEYQCFGGMYLPWYHHGKPYWYKEKYGTNRMRYKTISTLKNGEYACGGIMAYKVDLLKKYKGFSTKLGMNGDKVAYGEETELQVRMRRDGMKIAYDPLLKMDHLVADYKLNIDWFFKAHFALGRDQIEMGIAKTNSLSLLMTTIVLIGMIILHLLWFTPKLLKSDYFIQNWMIDVFKKPAKRVGILYTALLNKSRQKYGLNEA